MSWPLVGMGEEYSRSPRGRRAAGPLLAIDTGSPTASVAVGGDGQSLAERSLPQRGSSESLLGSIADCLDAAGLALGDLAGCLCLRGPGSFTGLRVGMATALGLHQATGLPVAALDTLPVLAAACGVDGRVLAVVDALRGEWFSQAVRVRSGAFPEPIEAPRLRTAGELRAQESAALSGFGTSALADSFAAAAAPLLFEPPSLAPTLLRVAALREPEWDVERLLRPLYLRPAAAAPAAVEGRPKRC